MNFSWFKLNDINRTTCSLNFSVAIWEQACTFITKPCLASPRPNTLILAEDLHRPILYIPSTVNWLTPYLSDKSLSWSRLKTWYSTLLILLKPNLGNRIWVGVWPPSNPLFRFAPALAFWPLWPLVAVPPWPEPSPRAILFLYELLLLQVLNYVIPSLDLFNCN